MLRKRPRQIPAGTIQLKIYTRTRESVTGSLITRVLRHELGLHTPENAGKPCPYGLVLL